MKFSIFILAIAVILAAVIFGGFYYASTMAKIQAEKEQQNKLDSCLDSMWSLYGNNDELYQLKSESCYKEFK